MARVECAYCTDEATTVDHVWPRSRGGTDDPRNLVPACRRCNSSKASKSLLNESCEGCRELRTPGDVDCSTGAAYYTCRCGASWVTFWNLQLLPMLIGAV